MKFKTIALALILFTAGNAYAGPNTHVGQMDTDGILSPGELRNPRINYNTRQYYDNRNDDYYRSRQDDAYYQRQRELEERERELARREREDYYRDRHWYDGYTY